MAGWILVPCLVALRGEFNAIAPNRDKGSDGSIGDVAHAAGGTSDHLPDEDFPALRDKDADHVNEVHAIDIDTDLRTPGLTLDQVVQHILGRCRRAASDPLNEPRLRYIIWDRHIYQAPGWTKLPYSGTDDPHTGHAHFSAEYVTSLESDTSSWHLEDLVALTNDEVDRVADATVTRIKAELPGADAVPWSSTINYTLGGAIYDTRQATIQILASLAAFTGRDFVDEPAIVAGVLQGLAAPERSDEDVAAALRAALGDRAAAVGALLVG